MIEFPQCWECRNLTEQYVRRMACRAFPTGIPREILFNEHDHTKPYPGDHGILFDPDDEYLEIERERAARKAAEGESKGT